MTNLSTATPTIPAYTEEDHDTWSKLIERQSKLVAGRACSLFMEGFPKLELDPQRLPDPTAVSRRLHDLTGWTLADAQNEFLNGLDWFEHLNLCHFPVTNYIRRPHELDYTPLPDLFHEYFGHLGFFTDQRFADDSQMFGQLNASAKDDRQRLGISRLWWFTTEFGLIREDGEVKVYGAGLLSSPGELLHALRPETPHLDADLHKMIETQSSPYAYHSAYFVLDSYEQLRQLIYDYAEMEGLPAPMPIHG